MDWAALLKMGHVIGTVLGAGSATLAEVFSMQLAKRAAVTPKETPNETVRTLLNATYVTLRIGTIVLVVSGFGYLLRLRLMDNAQYLYSPRLWFKLALTLVIVLNAIYLHKHKIPFWLGSAISFTSWYAALILGAWRGLEASFITISLWYLVALGVVAVVLHLIRRKITRAV